MKLRIEPSPATPEEDSYDYRIRWDESTTDEWVDGKFHLRHNGPGSMDISGYDNAWDAFEDCRNNTDIRNPHLYRIEHDGTEFRIN